MNIIRLRSARSASTPATIPKTRSGSVWSAPTTPIARPRPGQGEDKQRQRGEADRIADRRDALGGEQDPEVAVLGERHRTGVRRRRRDGGRDDLRHGSMVATPSRRRAAARWATATRRERPQRPLRCGDGAAQASDALDPGRPTPRSTRPDRRGRGQPVDPARCRPPAGHPRVVGGRARGVRPRRRVARASRARADVGDRPGPDLRPGDPPRDPCRPARHRRGGPRAPAGVDGADPGRRGARPGGTPRDRVPPAAAADGRVRGAWAAKSSPRGSLRPSPRDPSRSPMPRSWSAMGPRPSAPIRPAVDRLELVEVLCRAWRDSLLIRAARVGLGIV